MDSGARIPSEPRGLWNRIVRALRHWADERTVAQAMTVAAIARANRKPVRFERYLEERPGGYSSDEGYCHSLVEFEVAIAVDGGGAGDCDGIGGWGDCGDWGGGGDGGGGDGGGD